MDEYHIGRIFSTINSFSCLLIKGEGKDATPRQPLTVAELKTLYRASLSYGKLRLTLPILGEIG